MKILLPIIGICLFTMPLFGQQRVVDSLYSKLAKEKKDTVKAIILYQLSSHYQTFKPDSALLLAQTAYKLSLKHKFLKGETWALNQMAGAFNRLGNYTQALEYFIQQLKMEEQQHIPYNIASVQMNIAMVYDLIKDTDKALLYSFKADSIIRQNNLADLSVYNFLNIGDIYEKLDNLPLALYYTLKSYKEALKNKNSYMTGTALNNLGNIYFKMGETDKSIQSFEASLPYLTATNNYNFISECNLGLSKSFNKKGMQDSAIGYAIQSYNLSFQNNFLGNALHASTFLSQLYKQQHNIDSAFVYQEIMIGLKDSIESNEKARAIQLITIEEQLRQKEIAELLQQEKKERYQKLQLLAIGVMIPICFFVSAYLSRKKVHKKVIEFSGIISLLLLFEYITLLIHPFVAEKTHHNPFYEIIIFICIAAIITPTHHKIEKWLIAKLTKIHEEHHKKPIVEQTETAVDEEEKQQDNI